MPPRWVIVTVLVWLALGVAINLALRAVWH